MKLSVNIIYDNLPYQKCFLWDTQVNNRVIEDIMFLHGAIKSFTTDHLYVGSVSLLPPFKDIPDNANFLCYGQCPFPTNQKIHFNLIMVEEYVRVYELFNLLQNIVTKYYLWQEKLEAGIQQTLPLQYFLDVSDKVIGWPLSIIDIAKKALAISSFLNPEDIIWNELQNGYVQTELTTLDNVVNKKDSLLADTSQIYSIIYNRLLLTNTIKVHDHTVAFLSAHHTKEGATEFVRSTEQLLNYLANAVSKRMALDEFYQYSRGFVLDCLIADLIDRKITDPDTIKDRLAFSQIEGNIESRIALIEETNNQVRKHNLRTMLNEIESILPHAKALYYHGGIVILQQVSYDDVYTKKTDQDFIQWLMSHHACNGVSNRFTDYAHLADYYNQAKKAAYYGNIMQPEKCIHYYRDFINEHMFEILSEHIDLRLLLHPDIKHLLNYSKTKDYIYETLHSYIEHDFNLLNTSKALFVHKNTLSYRLHQIEEYAGISLSNPETRNALIQSMNILTYMVAFLHYNIKTDTYDQPIE